ncbi:hypothetical protein EYC80_002448 [Monilinia laxa]|uniref:Uncharacterized protein n=1 Tax=Monilinia laxa TaxID=61186 RepID=A0A5N6K412_MONLA|nr:hypothetical protein EYC80_002448 [Monilinia laxa]
MQAFKRSASREALVGSFHSLLCRPHSALILPKPKRQAFGGNLFRSLDSQHTFVEQLEPTQSLRNHYSLCNDYKAEFFLGLLNIPETHAAYMLICCSKLVQPHLKIGAQLDYFQQLRFQLWSFFNSRRYQIRPALAALPLHSLSGR